MCYTDLIYIFTLQQSFMTYVLNMWQRANVHLNFTEEEIKRFCEIIIIKIKMKRKLVRLKMSTLITLWKLTFKDTFCGIPSTLFYEKLKKEFGKKEKVRTKGR